MKLLLALPFLAGLPLAHSAPACPAPGDPLHWRADFCMLKMETDDEIAVSGCIAEEGKRRFPSSCASNTYFKKRMCERMVRNGTRAGTVDSCLQDPGFQGRTVENGGVGS